MTVAPSVGSAGVDALLDAGAVGLRFFVEFLPRAHRIGAVPTVTVPDLTDRYDAQRGLDIARLASDADVMKTLSSVVGSGADEQRARLATVPAVWEGRAGCSASEPLAAHVERSRRLHETVGVLGDTLAGAATGIFTIVDEKSRAASSFADVRVDGLGPAEVDAVLAGASGAGIGPVVEQLAHRSTGLVVDAEAAAQWCARWLREVFAPGVESAVGVFVGLCDDADRAIGAVFDELARVFESLDEHRFPGIGTDGIGTGGIGTDRPSGGRRALESGGEVVPAWGSSGASSSDVVRAGVSLVESGLELVAAVGELTGAVVELAAAMVDGATTMVEGATVAVEATTGELSDSAPVEHSAPVEPVPGPARESTPPISESPAAEPEVAATGTEPVDGLATSPSGPTAAPGPMAPVSTVETGRADPAAERPAPALVPGSGVSAPASGRGRRTGPAPENSGDVPTAARGPADPAEFGPDGGVILPEAGPL